MYKANIGKKKSNFTLSLNQTRMFANVKGKKFARLVGILKIGPRVALPFIPPRRDQAEEFEDCGFV